MTNFQNQKCVVVGSSGGIGDALVLELRKRGAVVIPINRSGKQKEYQLDISDFKSISNLASQIGKDFGKIDHLFNATGIAAYKDFLKLTPAEIERVITTNLIGAIILTQRFIPLMNNGASVVHFGSMAGIRKNHKFFSVYAASKEGLAGFLRSISVEFPSIKFVLATLAGVKTKIAENAIGSESLLEKFAESHLDSPRGVAKGILDNLGKELSDNDVRIFPTELSFSTYEKIC